MGMRCVLIQMRVLQGFISWLRFGGMLVDVGGGGGLGGGWGI